MDTFIHQRVINANNVFDDTFVDTKRLYLYYFNVIPSVNFIGSIDGEKTFELFRDKYATQICSIYRTRWYKSKKKRYQFDRTIYLMSNNCVVEFDDDYCEILHNNMQEEFVNEITQMCHQFREKRRKQSLEINLVVKCGNRIDLKSMEIKKTKLDLDLFYEDDFKATDEVIKKRLRSKNDKGIVLLHGLPGTGKTTYLRYLIGKIKKRVLFLSPSAAENLMNPEFMELLIDNPNSVVIIEDAENVIMDRRYSAGSSVSNLLNISDGLLADFLNVQLICTFNNSLTMVDNALMRKGRLIAKYEFGKLGIRKAQQLADHLGSNIVVDKPMTIAEIANPSEIDYKTERVEVIGFRRNHVMEN